MNSREVDTTLVAANPIAKSTVDGLPLAGAEQEMLASIVQEGRAARSAPRPRPSWQRILAPALAALVLISAGLYAVPATRAAIEDAVGSVAEVFTGYSKGDAERAPGRPLAAGEPAPTYFHDGSWAQVHVNDPRVLAEAGGYKLYAYRGSHGDVNFDLGDTGVGVGFPGAGELRGSAIYVLGPGSMSRADREGHIPLFGVVADSVTGVELTYETGPPLRLESIRDGFVLLAEPAREPKEVVAYDDQGDVVAREPVTYIGWSDFLR